MSTQDLVVGEERDLPLVRMRRRWFRTNVVAFYERGVLLGTLQVSHFPVTEEMLQSEGVGPFKESSAWRPFCSP